MIYQGSIFWIVDLFAGLGGIVSGIEPTEAQEHSELRLKLEFQWRGSSQGAVLLMLGALAALAAVALSILIWVVIGP